MRFAWYGRKSTYSDKSDSVDNQRKMCKDYAYSAFENVESWAEYSDEDFTGANADRPDLQRLLKDVRLRMYDALIVYQLDRLSRSVRDFSNIYAELEKYGVQFVSLKERIDTTTSIGKAMMYVTVVFAQMERETIATRVKDNMHGLAKKGFWRVGNPPIGYTAVRREVGGKKHLVLEPDPEGAEHFNWLIDSFLSCDKSLSGLSHMFRDQGIKTRSGCYFSKATIHHILISPYGAANTPELYDYYANKGCQMLQPREEWNGEHGIIISGLRSNKDKHIYMNPPGKWLVCIGQHEPIVSAKKWLAVQKKLSMNTFDREPKYAPTLLKGVLRCRCGSLMGTTYRKRTNGIEPCYYCRKRTERGKTACSCPSVSAKKLDSKVMDIFHNIAANPSLIDSYAHEDELPVLPETKDFDAEIHKAEIRIQKLTEAISEASDSSATKYMVKEIERLDLNVQALQREKGMALSKAQEAIQERKSIDDRKAEAIKAVSTLDGLNAWELNQIARKVIKSCVWDGKNLKITL